MAMLAERREKKRYVLMPRGKPLFNDSNRFGTKMLEKMGWSKGKGLGANENGSEEFIRIRYKNNNVGLGYKDRDDQWTENENRFDCLLKSLNNSANNSDSEEMCNERAGLGSESKSDEFALKKFESLEEKSKSSKSRVHYRKFTKRKDLSQYSEKDLANIFGKKFLSAEPIDDQIASNSLNTEREHSKKSKDNNCGKEDVNEEESLEKEKEIAKTKEKSVIEETGDSNFLESHKKKKKKKSKSKEHENPSEIKTHKDENTFKEIQSELKVDEDIDKSNSVKKRSKKRKLKEITIDISSDDDTNNVSDIIVIEPSKKKKKTEQKDLNITNERDIPDNLISSERNDDVIEINDDLKVKKKKKSKHKKDEEENQISNETIPSEVILVKSDAKTLPNEPDVVAKQKHKKNKHKLTEPVVDLTEDLEMTEKPLKLSIEENKTEQTILRTSVENNIDKTNTAEITIKESDSLPLPTGNNKSEKIESNRTHEIEENYKNGKTYVLSALQAEVFRFADFRAFKNSNINDIIGYSLSKDIQLKMKHGKNDEIKICNLWEKAKKAPSQYKMEKGVERKKKFRKYVNHLKKVHSFVKV